MLEDVGDPGLSPRFVGRANADPCLNRHHGSEPGGGEQDGQPIVETVAIQSDLRSGIIAAQPRNDTFWYPLAVAPPAYTSPMVAGDVMEVIRSSEDILSLATGLLRICRAHLAELIRCDTDLMCWRRRDGLRRACEELFERVDDEELDPAEVEELCALVEDAFGALPPCAVARTVAEALDEVLGFRFLPMFLNRTTALGEGDGIPTPHPDWRNLSPTPNSDPWALDGRLDALPHLRLAGDWSRHVEVSLDGDWRIWHSLPQLDGGDKLACAVPNASFEEFDWDVDTVEERPVFYNVRPALGDDEQTARCLSLLELARQNGCRLVAFPELSVPARTVDAMRRWLERQQVVELIVAGSRHKKSRDGRWHNEATLLLRGLPKLTHRKFRAFSFIDTLTEPKKRVRRTEHLAVRVPRVRAWLSPNWTVTLLVCKDVVQEPLPALLADLRANLVLVPCLSFKMDAFRSAAGTIATRAQGITLVANAAISLRGTRQRGRPPIIIGVPSQVGSVIAKTPPTGSLLVMTLGNSTSPGRTEVVGES